ncbi:VIT1/CCC1 transporter family protein [bacterium]|nr:VIT1/CCC1 transporter family protein [bacterium]
MCNKHFTEDNVVEHMQKARNKGKQAFSEFHAVEAPGHISAGSDSAADSAISSLLVFIIAHALAIPMNKIFILLTVLMTGIFLWKVGRSMHLAWSRLERINSLVMEEKYEIENNREEEREELTEMYAAKGFREPLLTKIIDVLMADDNKLLAVMLEEELGVPMDAYVHPIKQALGAGVGVIITALSIPLGLAISETFGLFITTFAITGIAAFFMAKIEKISTLEYTIKSLAITFLATFTTYFFTKFLIHEIL